MLSLDVRLAGLVAEATSAQASTEIARQALAMVDLTSLNDDDTPERIAALCAKAVSPAGPVAAVCVFPQFVAQANRALDDSWVRVATVVNFPAGTESPDRVADATRAAIDAGADEIDVVIAVPSALAGDLAPTRTLLTATRAACGTAPMKVILESGLFTDAAALRAVAIAACECGADFLKTSTGKVPQGASLQAAAILLSVIADGRMGVGFKASGGVRTVAQAAQYLTLADLLLGVEWARPSTFRFGASGLLDALLGALGYGNAQTGTSAY
jgi:deoxyribose-phosphate aldolase